MHLPQTTILPADDDTLAQRMLRELIYEQPVILMIVFGNDTDAETTVQRADRLALAPRRVAWARSVSAIRGVVDGLVIPPTLREGLPGRALTLSLGDDVRDVITADEPVPTPARLFKAFNKAEASR